MTSTTNNIVKKLLKSKGKLINNNDIKKIIEKTTDHTPSDSQLYKTTHTLKNKGYIISVKKNCFLISSPDIEIDKEEIINNHYRELLNNHCQEYLQGPWYIGGIKALEIHLQNYGINETIEIVNTHKNAIEVIMFDKSVNYKTYTHQKINIFSKIKKMLCTQKIQKTKITYANIELAILETLHNPDKGQMSLIKEYVKKAIRKHKKTINFDYFATIIQNNKHHVGINRLHKISKSVDPLFAEKIYCLIKKYSFITKTTI